MPRELKFDIDMMFKDAEPRHREKSLSCQSMRVTIVSWNVRGLNMDSKLWITSSTIISVVSMLPCIKKLNYSITCSSISWDGKYRYKGLEKEAWDQNWWKIEWHRSMVILSLQNHSLLVLVVLFDVRHKSKFLFL